MKNTVKTFAKMKAAGEKISMLTCYDYTTAKLEEAAGINAKAVTVPGYLSGRFVAEQGLKAPGSAKLVYDADTSRALGAAAASDSGADEDDA